MCACVVMNGDKIDKTTHKIFHTPLEEKETYGTVNTVGRLFFC